VVSIIFDETDDETLFTVSGFELGETITEPHLMCINLLEIIAASAAVESRCETDDEEEGDE
jgi:hypothetical protein